MAAASRKYRKGRKGKYRKRHADDGIAPEYYDPPWTHDSITQSQWDDLSTNVSISGVTPERMLLLAVMERAWLDAGLAVSGHKMDGFARPTGVQLRDWVRGRTASAVSFDDICTVFGISTEKVGGAFLRRIRRAQDAGRRERKRRRVRYRVIHGRK